MEDSEDIIINDQDGLPNIHPSLLSEDIDCVEQEDRDELDDLPSSLIVTNISDSVFLDPNKKLEMENLFKIFDSEVTFQWLRSFHRLRVNFQTSLIAASARIQLHQYKLNESIITCYFAQPVTPVKNSFLEPPKLTKQFLISPPASPPLDWQPRSEGEPMINHDLLAALANLSPGVAHELHPPSPGQPSIVLNTALNPTTQDPKKIPIVHTSCPKRV